MADNIFEKMTEEERTLTWMYMIFNRDKIIEKTEEWTKEAEEVGMTLTEYLESISPLNERMNEIKCPHDLNQFLLGEPIFKNTFPEEECEQRKFYGDCYHCFSTAIASRDHAIRMEALEIIDKHRAESEDKE